MQQAYLNAFTHLQQFAERASFSTWLTRIAIHEALGRRRRSRPADQLASDLEVDAMSRVESAGPSPEHQAYASELKRLVEESVDALPDSYRAVHCGYGSGDSPDNVRENRRRAAATFGLGEPDLLTVHQIHSTEVLTVDDRALDLARRAQGRRRW